MSQNIKMNLKGVHITPREKDLIACLVCGKSNKKIAYLLGITYRTVETHIKNILSKLEVSSRGDIIDLVEQSNQYLELKQHYTKILEYSSGNNITLDESIIISNPEKKSSSKTWPSISKSRIKYFIYSIVIFTFLISSYFSFFYRTDFYNFFASKEPIISTLNIPHQSSFLHRFDLLKKIKKALQMQSNIQTVILTGIGGAGKTVLARYYALSQKSSLVWEVNAETIETLVQSFEILAHTLIQNEKERFIINFMKDIKDPEKKLERIFLLIQKYIKKYKGWILIYDNVEKFNNIYKYLPKKSNIWGKGKIIITTRDSNIANYSLSNPEAIIFIKELSEQEKYTLFSKILFRRNGNFNAKKIMMMRFLNS